ncbi:hypothetical protein [Helicobacter cappadocius]|uniref:Sialidase A n=1 Tax=Helicobacter cappadocius TaxID=3063998 RepID=A0AA90PQM7_9HELI|nr:MULTISPECIES: hypothetical protein [unclassified Helicobacter]MDO7252944.1 hypothetical protein [Helicobacter sp. faydin-H75]MDP2539066.1 hypothetical protein [Helicobacter sp. faydin-H76]
MDEAIDILKKIGVKEINKTTKISINKIEDILEKRFSNVQRVRVVGFLKILEREYKVDLSSWLKEYDERFFVDIDTQDDGRDLVVEPPVSNLYLDTQKQKDDLIEERKKQIISKKRFYILIVVVVVILGGYLVYKSFSHHSEMADTQDIAQSSQTTQDVDISTQLTPKESQDEAQTSTGAKSDFDSKEDGNVSEINKIQAPSVSPEPKVANKASDLATTSSETLQPSDQNIPEESEILVTPKKSLWVEVIDLDTKEKKQTIIQDSYSIKTGSDSLLISFGHGELTLQNNDERVEYDKAYPLRFLYTPKDGLKQIRYSKYLELSGQEQ